MSNNLTTISTCDNQYVSNRDNVLYSMAYFGAIKYNNCIFSIDNLRLKYTFANKYEMDIAKKIIERGSENAYDTFYILNKSSAQKYYKNTESYTMQLKNNAAVYVEFVTGRKNGSMTYACEIEYNPNKCCGIMVDIIDKTNSEPEEVVFTKMDLMEYIISDVRRHAVTVKIMRFDLAVDIPVNRCLVNMIKDNRSFCRFVPSTATVDNYTDYLGTQHKSGYCKVYSKSLESGLNYDLTRVEMTSIYHDDYDKFIVQWPEVYAYTYGINIPDFFENLNQTESVLCQLLATSPYKDMYYRSLGRRMRYKLKPYLYQIAGCIMVTVPEEIYNVLMTRIRTMAGAQNAEDKHFALKLS